MSNPVQGYNTYIGARYVPIFDGEWDGSKMYEPLMIVTYQGNSYTSRTYVPVGVPVTNETYWANTGNYNAQIEAYREEVIRYRKDVIGKTDSWLAGKNIVAYGDSTMSIADSYISQLADIYEVNIQNRSISGTKMSGGAANSGYQMIATASDLGTFDYVLLGYGTNDWQSSAPIIFNYSVNSFEWAYEETVKKILAENSIPVLITPFYSYRPDFKAIDLRLYAECIEDIANKYHVPCINFYNNSGCNELNYTDLLRNDSGGIYVHETVEFGKKLADMIYEFSPYSSTRNVKWSELWSLYNTPTKFMSPSEALDHGVPNSYISGPILLGPGEYRTQYQVTISGSDVLRISGYAEDTLTLKIEGSGNMTIGNVNLPKGIFDFFYKAPSSSIGNIIIVNNHTKNICLSNFSIKTDAHNRNNYQFFSYPLQVEMKPGISVYNGWYFYIAMNQWFSYAPSCRFTVTTEIAEGNSIFGFQSNVNARGVISCLMHQGDGLTIPIYFLNDNCICLAKIPPGTYYFPSTVFC